MCNSGIHPMSHFNVPMCTTDVHFLQLLTILLKQAVKHGDFEQNLNPGLTSSRCYSSCSVPHPGNIPAQTS